jgi:hypothetical protein
MQVFYVTLIFSKETEMLLEDGFAAIQFEAVMMQSSPFSEKSSELLAK